MPYHVEGEADLTTWFLAERDNTGWMEHAACIAFPPDLWYAEYPHRKDIAKAKNICASCMVRVQCLADALRRDEGHGIWGGYTSTERTGLTSPYRAGGSGLRQAS